MNRVWINFHSSSSNTRQREIIRYRQHLYSSRSQFLCNRRRQHPCSHHLPLRLPYLIIPRHNASYRRSVALIRPRLSHQPQARRPIILQIILLELQTTVSRLSPRCRKIRLLGRNRCARPRFKICHLNDQASQRAPKKQRCHGQVTPHNRYFLPCHLWHL